MKHNEDFELGQQDRVWADAFREAIHAESEQPAWFWSKQQAAIRGRITSRSRGSSAWMAFASVTALCLFAVLLIGGMKGPSAPPAQVSVAETHMDAEKLLAAVQDTIDNPVPDSLAPVDLLAQDMDKEFTANHKLAKQ